MSDEAVLASLDRHFSLHSSLGAKQWREHHERSSCVSCDLRATAEENPRWVEAGRPMLPAAAS